MRNRDRKHDGPIKIGSLFEKYRTRLRPPQGVVVTAFCAIVERELGIKLPSSSVRYTTYSRTISVTARGPEKTEILLNQKKILAECRTVLGPNGAPEHVV